MRSILLLMELKVEIDAKPIEYTGYCAVSDTLAAHNMTLTGHNRYVLLSMYMLTNGSAAGSNTLPAEL